MKGDKISKDKLRKPAKGVTKSKKDLLAIRDPQSGGPKATIRNRQPGNPQIDALRKKAERKLREQSEKLRELSTNDIQHLIHELGTHQIELEMQNEELRRAQEELEASRSRYSDLYDFAPVEYFTLNEKGLILEANLTAARELNIERSHIINKPFTVFVITKDRNNFAQHLREVFKSDSRQTCEIRLMRKSGIEFHARLESILVQDLNGAHVCRTSLIDITETKKAETLLREERDFISAVLSTEGALVVVLDLQGRIVSFNKTCELITGYSFDEVKGLSLWELLLIPEDVKAVKAVFRELKAGQYSNKHENYWVTKDKHHRLISWSNTSLLDSNGNVKYVISTGIDVTERKRAEDEIKRFASFPQLNPNPVLEVDSSGVIVFCNAGALLALRELNIGNADVFLPGDLDTILNRLRQGNEASLYREVNIKDKTFAETLHLSPEFNAVRIYANDITERIQAQETLQHSEEYFRLLMENAPGAVTILDGDGIIRYESLSVERMLGYKPDELVGTSAFDLIHPDDLSDVTTIFSYAARNPGIVLSAQFRCKHKDGSWRFLDAMGKNLLDNSAIRGIVINSRDITESMQAAQALRSERQRLINILDSMVDGVYIVSQQNEIEYVNPILEREYGPVNGRKCHDYFEGRKKACTWCKNQEVFEGKTVRSEWYSEKTNKTYDLINTPLRNPDGSVSKLGIFRDITQRKRAEQKLRESEEKFRTIFNGSNDGILIADAGSKEFIMGNNAICAMLGYSQDEIKNISVIDIHPQEHLPSVEKEFERMARGETIFNENIPVKRKDGSVFYVDINASHITLSGKTYIVGSFRDITERKQKEEELHKLNRTLKALSDSDHAMLHAKSEEEFLKDVCEIVVQDCGHAMVWIGFAEEDEDKTVRPVASAGFKEGYLEALNITWVDTERGRGPTGTAIRTGRPSICRNMLTDPAFEPWRDEAIKRGYASSIVLPLLTDGKTFGAINIYSREPDPFTEAEVRLLSELAGDLSYGILTMRTRVAHAKAEEAVRRSEARLATFAAATFEGIVYSREGRIVDCNEQLARMMGYTMPELLGRDIADLLAPEDRDRVMVNIGQGLPSETEHAMIRKDGSRVIVEAHGRTDTDGPRGNRMTVVRDITERKQAEEEIQKLMASVQQERDKLSTLLNSIPDEVWFADMQKNFTLANPAALHEFSYDTANSIDIEAMARSLEVYRPDGTPRPLEEAPPLRALEGQTIRNQEEIIRTPARGELRHRQVNAAPVMDASGNIIGSVSVVRDITERKQVEERLREAKEFSDALNRINEVVSSTLDQEEILRAVVTGTGKAIGCETAAISLRKDDHWEVSYVFGFSQELIGTEMVDEQEPHAILALETRKPVAINDAYNDERVNREHMKKYGIRSVLVVPLFLENEPLGVIFLNYHTLSKPFTDVEIDFVAKVGAFVSIAIEKVRLLNALKLRAAELEAVNKELEAFSYTISHDLKTPLRSIQGFAQAIMEDYEDRLDDAGRDSLHRINSAGERMTQLIDAMLEISRVTSRDLMNKSVDLSSIAELTAYELKKKEPERVVEFIISEGAQVLGDQDLLEIALRNLFDNAWKFTSKHATAKIEFGVTQMDGKNIYFVRDDGTGFNMEFADKLFMPFKRLHAASEFPGLGIGLAIVKKIINKHGGKIWAEGEPEKGATFYFTLG